MKFICFKQADSTSFRQYLKSFKKWMSARNINEKKATKNSKSNFASESFTSDLSRLEFEAFFEWAVDLRTNTAVRELNSLFPINSSISC